MLKRLVKKSYIFLYRILINVLASIYILFDEVFSYLSDKISILISSIPNIEETTEYNIKLLRSQNKYIILALLIAFIAASEYIGVISLIMFGTGHIVFGILLYISKFIPFFLMSFVFRNSKDILFEISWFKYCFEKFELIRDYFKETFVYKEIIKIKDLLKQKYSDLKKHLF